MSSDKITIYCDGSCHNPRGERTYGIKGGYGVHISWNGKVKRIISKRYDFTTNNRMELMAATEAMRAIIVKRGYKIEIISDSQYVTNAVNERWVFSWEQQQFIGRKNEDLWIKFLEEYRKFRPNDIKFTWVKGHNGTEGNEVVDRLAAKAGASTEIIIDQYEESVRNI